MSQPPTLTSRSSPTTVDGWFESGGWEKGGWTIGAMIGAARTAYISQIVALLESFHQLSSPPHQLVQLSHRHPQQLQQRSKKGATSSGGDPASIIKRLLQIDERLHLALLQLEKQQKLQNKIKQMKLEMERKEQMISEMVSHLRSAELSLESLLHSAIQSRAQFNQAKNNPSRLDDLIAYSRNISVTSSAPPEKPVMAEGEPPRSIYKLPYPDEASLRASILYNPVPRFAETTTNQEQDRTEQETDFNNNSMNAEEHQDSSSPSSSSPSPPMSSLFARYDGSPEHKSINYQVLHQTHFDSSMGFETIPAPRANPLSTDSLSSPSSSSLSESSSSSSSSAGFSNDQNFQPKVPKGWKPGDPIPFSPPSQQQQQQQQQQQHEHDDDDDWV